MSYQGYTDPTVTHHCAACTGTTHAASLAMVARTNAIVVLVEAEHALAVANLTKPTSLALGHCLSDRPDGCTDHYLVRVDQLGRRFRATKKKFKAKMN